MGNSYITLTEVDRTILSSYQVCIDGLAEYLGDGYEIILHSLENLDKSVIKAINGHYTGRSEGAPITDFALGMLKKIQESKQPQSISYFTKNKNGETLKSTTIPILGEQGRIIGLLCINFHTEISLAAFLASLTPPQDGTSPIIETFSDNVDDLIAAALAEAKSRVLVNPSISTSNKNKVIIGQLYAKGVFNLKDSVIKVSEMLDISKNTVYLHLRNLDKQHDL
ncbi:MAG: transcriptional regulator [Candidatus Fimivivens sp.]